jgi:anthranilate synthase component 1
VVAFGQLNLAHKKIKVEPLTTTEDQFGLFKKIQSSSKRSFILESLVGPKELAEMSVIGFDPEITVTCTSKEFIIESKGIVKRQKVTEPLTQLQKLVPLVKDDTFRYIGGAVGYVSYDAIRFWEKLPVDKKRKEKNNNNNNFPLMEFGIYTDGILYNHLENRAYYFSLGRSRLSQIQRKLAKKSSAQIKKVPFSYTDPKRSLTKEYFVQMTKMAKKYVYDGDIFQTVLSKKIKFKVKGDLLRFYEALREVNPSPYMYFVKMGPRSIIGSSPEMLIRITDDLVETFPIAGTRPIGKDENENEKLRQDLLKDEKELAEHTMLVDLARNDIGRVCKYGTVKVNDLMTIKRFSHVQHIVSHVTGKLGDSCNSYDALRAVFPAGTVSGAPKVRAMQIIDELEPDIRGPYAGALGYFSFNGSCDFAITIRSLFVDKQQAYIQSGAGIVMDSDPEKEWDETEHKANALLSALRQASSSSSSP